MQMLHTDGDDDDDRGDHVDRNDGGHKIRINKETVKSIFC